MKNITILGATGSIGMNALEIIRENEDKFKVIALSGNQNVPLLMRQVDEFDPKYISVGTEEAAIKLRERYYNKEIYFGDEGLKKLGALDEADIVLTAVSGAIGIDATVEAIKKSKRIALANKETMVAAGDYINKLLKEYPKAEIIPVDSEHSAIFQSMLSGKRDEVAKLIITASGGPFRGKTLKELSEVTLEEALKHPNWAMGKKITVDSATLVNKGLEIIEAHQLFGMNYDDIEVLVHPQSIIHSLVEFTDTSVVAQLGVPNMKLPIQYALTYPDRTHNPYLNKLNLREVANLSFEAVDMENLKGVALGYKAGRAGGTMPIVFNAANECAVALFLEGKIKFLEIYKIIEEAMETHFVEEVTSLDIIKRVDKKTREDIYEVYGS